jgi:hypothetical protein
MIVLEFVVLVVLEFPFLPILIAPSNNASMEKGNLLCGVKNKLFLSNSRYTYINCNKNLELLLHNLVKLFCYKIIIVKVEGFLIMGTFFHFFSIYSLGYLAWLL